MLRGGIDHDGKRVLNFKMKERRAKGGKAKRKTAVVV
jgi:hypothetical protein